AFEQRIEVGPWLEVGHRLDGESAKQILYDNAWHGNPSDRPYCLYVHVPFCTSRCSYCTLYTRAVTANQTETFDEYLWHVEKAVANHPAVPSARPPSTVHFGGGTPLTIGMQRFTKLIAVLRAFFGDSRKCEWAMETTTSSLDQVVMEQLKSQGIDRIHLGIQTLDDEIRRQIKRRESADTAIQKIRQLHASGFLTSVDLIIGFENQTEDTVQSDLEQLYAAGIRMFSICELRHFNIKKEAATDKQMQAKNRRFWQLIWRFMDEHRLLPIHIGQFGRSYEDNLYFTHPVRGEDCVAIGPYAHGCAGRLYYSNKLLPAYYKAIQADESPIEFAVIYNEDIQTIRQLESELLAHRIAAATIAALAARWPDIWPGILENWFEQQLLQSSSEKDYFGLSCNGSWFVGNMIAEIRQLASTNGLVPIAGKNHAVQSPLHPEFADTYSHGCQLCQQGKWLCVYLTYLCNAKCAFCPAPIRQEDRVFSDFGDDLQEVYEYYARCDFAGVGFSGGDCFLAFERLLQWLSFFKRQSSEGYFWTYTNGLEADECKLIRLADAGLNEIRFNIAATGYDSKKVHQNLTAALKWINNVAVEIPSIPADFDKLTAVLPTLDQAGVKFLNLHEYILTPEDPQKKHARVKTFVLNKEASLHYDADSLQNTEKIKRFCERQGLRILVNSCSLQKKEVQMWRRRLTMGRLFQKKYEVLTSDGLLESYFCYPQKLPEDALQDFLRRPLAELEPFLVHPQEIQHPRPTKNRTSAKLTFLPPMTKDSHRKMLRVEICNERFSNSNLSSQ
ncbi:MAG: radical SAM protein, partial [bacterium]